MSSIHSETFVSILQSIEKAAEQPYVTRMIGKPKIPIFFVAVFHLMCQSLRVPEQRAHLYGVATTLLQMGLNAHESVDVIRPDSAAEVRKQQLLVLSGDYLSSLFYQRLARYGEMEGIRRLAEATCVINEQKMALYMEHAQEDRYQKREPWELIKQIESGLLTALADFFHVGDDLDLNRQWKKLLPELLLHHRLWIEEMETGVRFFEADWVREETGRLMRLLDSFPQREMRNALIQLIEKPIQWPVGVE